MSEPVPARGIVLAHGMLAEGLVDAVRQIAGAEADALTPLSNRGLSPEVLASEIRRLVGQSTAIIFTDLPSGSCSFAARRLCREQERVAVVAGVNLPILLDFVMYRRLPLEELVGRLLEKGRAAICCVPVELEGYARSAVSGR